MCKAFVEIIALFLDHLGQCTPCLGEELAGGPCPHPGGLLEGAGGGCEKSHDGKLCQGAPGVIRALRKVHEDRQRTY